MKSWKRITFMIFVLIGGTAFFGYWSMGQFDNAFDNLSASYASNALPNLSSIKTDAVELSSTTPEVSDVFATSTDIELSFTFPQKGAKVYIGCTYPISWQSSNAIQSIEIALVDAGTRDAVGPIASGLAKQNTIDADSQNIEWKVGSVWPGEYYIRISKINGVEKETRSKVFMVNNVPNGLSASEQEDICKESSS